jgi:hypothetical protein
MATESLRAGLISREFVWKNSKVTRNPYCATRISHNIREIAFAMSTPAMGSGEAA